MADKTTTLKTKTNDNVYPNVIGDNRDNAIVDSAHIKHTLTAEHKINFRIDDNVSNLIFNSLQKPKGLTKTELVGVGANGQENIEIGDNLTLANGKLSASGGGGSIDTLNIYSTESGDPFFEYPDLTNVEKGLYIVNVIASHTDPTIISSGFGYVDNSEIFGGKTLSLIISLPGPQIYSFTYGNEIVGGSPLLIPYRTVDKAIMIYNIDNNSFITLDHPEHNGFLYYDVNHLDTNYGYSWEEIAPSKTIPLFGKHSILVPKDSADTDILPLPADASTSTYVLKAVNGTVQWVKES